MSSRVWQRNSGKCVPHSEQYALWAPPGGASLKSAVGVGVSGLAPDLADRQEQGRSRPCMHGGATCTARDVAQAASAVL